MYQNKYFQELVDQKYISYWLRLGLIMIIIQIMIGGITRITESGLSITEWKPITGIMPPFTNEDWQTEFEKYKTTDQYIHLKSYISLKDFKFIFFWEWLHRNWARLIGVVFILPFSYFLLKKMITFRQSGKYWGLFALGGGQAIIGWLMVKSGLKKGNLFVEHTFLAIHFALSIITFCYILILLHKLSQTYISVSKTIQRLFHILLIMSSVQLVYGALMSGLRAAPFAMTWPTINGEWIPTSVWRDIGLLNLTNNPFIVQFIHRLLAYLLFVSIVSFFFYIRKNSCQTLVYWGKLLLSILFLQIILGILTVINAGDYTIMRWLAVFHQMGGLAFFIFLVWIRLKLKTFSK